MSWEEYLGLKFTAFIAGIVGGIISLTFETKLSFIRALMLIFVGGITAGYTFAAAEHYFSLSPHVTGLFGFTSGLISMRLVGTVINLADLVKRNPAVILSIPKFIAGLKDESRTTTNDSGDSGDVGTSVQPTGEEPTKGESST